MNENIEKLKEDLRLLVDDIPLKWGKIQNNIYDNKVNMFSIKSKDELDQVLYNFPKNIQSYYKRRWFLWQCSKIDEYLFYSMDTVTKNPNSRDKEWDIKFDKVNLNFDIKGTKIPNRYLSNFNYDEEKLINFYYQEQSKGIRYDIQNRLFIVHHSYRNQNNEMQLRCNWALKEKAYSEFLHFINTNNIDFCNYKNVIAKIIFLMEDQNGKCFFKII